jgi:type II secretory pathway component PulJ
MKKRSGLTLLEVVLSIGLTALIVIVLSKFSSTVTSVGTVINQRLQVQQDLEQTIQVMTTEIRSAGPSASGGYPLESAASSSFIFFSDVERDGVMERVRYYFGTSTLQKGVVEPSSSTPPIYVSSTEIVKAVIPNVIIGSSSFQYFGSSATSTAAPLTSPVDIAAVRFMRISISADVSTSSAPKPITFSNTITIRNLRSN